MNSHSRSWKTYRETGSQELKNRLILCYLPLVKVCARKISYGLPSHVRLDDLVSAGILGLVAAIEKFNPEAGSPFESFARLRIRGAILDELRHLDWIPRSIRAKARKLQDAYLELQHKLCRFPTETEVADHLGISMDDLVSLMQALHTSQWTSLDASVSAAHPEHALSSLIPGKNDNLPSEVALKEERREIMVKLIKDLSQQERIVLTLYYYEDLTLREIGEVIGVSESRVSQIHSRAILRLRTRLKHFEYTDHAPH